jgi:hypothetical protein
MIAKARGADLWLGLLRVAVHEDWQRSEELSAAAYQRQPVRLDMDDDGTLRNASPVEFRGWPGGWYVEGFALYDAERDGEPVGVPIPSPHSYFLDPGVTYRLAPGAIRVSRLFDGIDVAKPAMAKPCAECPWRRDVPTGKFPSWMIAGLADTAEPGHQRIFACHMHKSSACAGWRAAHGAENDRMRLLATVGALEWARRAGDAEPLLYRSFDEMARANGCDDR